MTAAIFAIFFLGLPAVLLLACRHVRVARSLGPIVLCYAAGLLIGLSGILPETAQNIRISVMEAALGLALPLLLFSVDVRAWGRVAGRAMLSMVLAVAAVVTVSTLLFLTFDARGVAQAEQLSGMAIGMYTGGIANLGAIKLALGIDDARYLLFATVDTVVGAVYLLFVLTIAARVFGAFLPAFDRDKTGDTGAIAPDETYADLLELAALPRATLAVLAAGACVGAALVLAPMIGVMAPEIAVIVLLTSFGLLASFIPALRNNSFAPKIGMYLIFVFSLCVAAGMDLSSLANIDLSILAFVLIATFASLALHALLCRLMGVDVDTFLITSVAALMSPAFVPMVARSLRNPAVLMSGMATGILGFAIGNYLGISVALLLGAEGTP